MGRLRVLVVGFYAIVGEGLRRLLEAEEDFAIVGVAADVDVALGLARASPPNIVLLDLRLPRSSCLKLTQSLRAELPGTRLVGLASEANAADARGLFRLGMRGYVLKDTSVQDLVDTLRAVHAGHGQVLVAASALAEETAAAAGVVFLTAQERRILLLVKAGLHNREIAARLGCTEPTIEGHLDHLYRKLAVHSRTAAVEQARERGWLE